MPMCFTVASLAPVALIALLAPASMPTTTADPKAVEILHRYIEVTGGKAAYERLTTREMRLSISVPTAKVSGTLEMQSKSPNKVRSVQKLEGRGASETAFNGETGWIRLAGRTARSLTAEELKQTKSQAGFNSALNAEKLYSTIRLAPPLPGDGRLDGNPVDRVELVSDSESIIQSYSHETGLLVQSEQTVDTAKGRQLVVTRYTNYKAVDGILYPHNTRTEVGIIVLEQTITEIKHNTNLPDSLFEKPDGAATREAN